jgi:preprotein translocase subunit Sec61beta
MSKDNKKLYMPMGAGGLMRFPEEEKEVIKLKPKHMIWIVAGIAVFEIALKIIF